jgi:hypothetical protein
MSFWLIVGIKSARSAIKSRAKLHRDALSAQLLEAVRMARKSAGEGLAAIRAGVVIQRIAFDVMPIAHDERGVAVRAMRGAALGVVDVAGVDVV